MDKCLTLRGYPLGVRSRLERLWRMAFSPGFAKAVRPAFDAGAIAYSQKVLGLFGSSLIAYWPLSEASGSTANDISGNGRNGAYTGVDLGQSGIGDGKTSPYFDGVNDYVDIYSAGLASAFNGAEGSLLLWFKVYAASVWSDATLRYMVEIKADSSNQLYILKHTIANRISFYYVAGGTSKNINATGLTSLLFFSLGFTWSKSNNRLRAYVSGIQSGTDQTGLGTWAGVPAATNTLIGAYSKNPTYVTSGYLAHALILNREATPAEMLTASKV